jgi:hypothetical protein
MSDDFEEESENERDRRQRRRQRINDDWYERPNVVSVFSRLGYNLYDPQDLNRLAANLRFAEEARSRDESYKARRLGWLISGVIAVLSAFATTLGTWLVDRIK